MTSFDFFRGFVEGVSRRAVTRQLLVLLLDGGIAGIAFWCALVLRFEGGVLPQPWAETAFELTLLLMASRVLASLLLRLHRWSFRFSSLSDGVRIVVAGLFGTGLFLFWIFLLALQGPPRVTLVLEFFLSTTLMGLARFSPRLAWMYLADHARARKNGGVRTLILGAGAAGEMLYRDLRRSNEHPFIVEGFADDDAGKVGMIVGGKPVLGTIEELPQILRRFRIKTVLVAIPRLTAERLREVLAMCADLKLDFKILPVSYVFLQERLSASMLKDLTPEDLLPRTQVTFEATEVAAGRTALVTGAAGSIGSEICSQLLSAGLARLVMVDVDENGLYLLQRRLEQAWPQAEIHTAIASIRDPRRIGSLFERYLPQDVFHAAAHKHVPLMEQAPCEAVKNNVLGTRIVAEAADRWLAERFVLISTDKAVRPTSIMGASKRIAEMIVRDRARRSATRFCAVRFGNVLGSAGSVVPLFREQIARGGPVTVTHPEVRRFFMTVREAVGLVLTAGYGDWGELCILDMGEQIRILDLARHMITISGLVPEQDIEIAFTGLRPGEKLYEELLTEEEEHTQRVHERIFVADCPAPRADLDFRLELLEQACRAEDPLEVVRLLHEMVPGWQTSPQSLSLPALSPTAAALH